MPERPAANVSPLIFLSIRTNFYQSRGFYPFPERSNTGSFCSTELTTNPYGFRGAERNSILAGFSFRLGPSHVLAGEVLFVDAPYIFPSRIEQLMHWAIMACETNDSRFSYLLRDAFVVQEELYIEEIPGMLMVQHPDCREV